tara:strand:- start:152 stop:778 length:627 start_codon:yes stop_codon:yes gene_type:complete
MAKLKRRSISIFARLRNYFITGIVVLVPIGITLYLTKFFISISSKLIPYNLNPNNYLPFAIPGLEILLSVIFITIIGGISLSFIGKRILQFVNDLFKRIPILRTIYSAIGQMTESLAPNKSGNKKSVVLIQYPSKGSWAVGFATKDNKGEISKKTNSDLVNVFVPTTPNPTSGFLLMFPKEEIIYLDMSFEEASKFIVSAGTSETGAK